MCMREMDILKRVPIFTGLEESDIMELKNICLKAKFQKGNIIFFEGDPGEAVHFIKSGKIKIYKSDSEGREHILNIYGPGDIFAETVLFEGGPYPASAEAIEDSVVWMIRNQDLENLFKKNIGMALKIIKILSKRLRESQEKVRNLALWDTYDRTACALHKMSLDHGINSSKGIEVDLPITRSELASMVGTSRETVTRMLMEMKKKGIIDIDKQKIIVLNESELMRCARK
jgi:CRP/FNR family cyclic AMP-dependent transcriptional regulator